MPALFTNVATITAVIRSEPTTSIMLSAEIIKEADERYGTKLDTDVAELYTKKYAVSLKLSTNPKGTE
jgi:hypothetical protein